VLRRYAKHDNADGEVIKFDNLEISLQKYELKIKGKPVDLPPKELELIYFLAFNYNRVFTRDQLLDKVWGFDYLGDSRTVDVHIKRLREKLEGASEKWTLKTIWGVGYKFEVAEE
jgi:DNA-binding response OmpR family regulator